MREPGGGRVGGRTGRDKNTGCKRGTEHILVRREMHGWNALEECIGEMHAKNA